MNPVDSTGAQICLATPRRRTNLRCMTRLAQLPARSVVEVAGEDRVAFLQGLVSNDVAEASPGRAVWAALLTPQGKWLADFFILSDGERLLLDCAGERAPLLVQRLSRFRLRSRVTVANAGLAVHAGWDGTPDDLPPTAVAAPDPRLPDAGWRILAAAALPATATEAEWDAHRLALGLPDTADLEAEKTLLLEAGFAELHGVSWTKGCYMGQELTARTRYRGLVKRRLVPVTVSGPLPAPGTPVLHDAAEVGTMRSGRDNAGLAVLRLDALEAKTLTCGAATLTPHLPAWLALPQGAEVR
jgi:tRNA-modifying protein YgfZ